jgi:hypothetical protein
MKITKKQYRQNIINRLIDVFDESGEECGCHAEVIGVVRDDAYALALRAMEDGYNYSKAQFINPVIMMRDMFAHECAKAIYTRQYGKRS